VAIRPASLTKGCTYFFILLPFSTCRMAIYSYRTIQSPAQGQYRDKGSKFLSFAFPVRSEEEVKWELANLKKKFFDASHHCYAYLLGADGKKVRANDDGEPNHSAGDPILGQIRSHQITNVAIVVVRYFGGTKLGVSGLIQAYRGAADEALKNAVIIEVEVQQSFQLKFAYADTAEVMRLINDFQLTVTDRSYEIECKIAASINLRHWDSFCTRLQLLKALHHSIDFTND